MHARAEGALEVVIVDRDHFGVAAAAGRAVVEIDLFHDFDEWILAEIQLGHAEQRFSVAG